MTDCDAFSYISVKQLSVDVRYKKNWVLFYQT